MCDVYIYRFVMSNSQSGENMVSERPATLDAIESRGGEPLMSSQIVVDETQLDADGFLVVAAGGEPEMDPIAAQIWSLEARAASRDKLAIASTDEIEKYMLSLESRELLKQSRALRSQHASATAAEFSYGTDARDFVHFGRGLAT